MKHVAQISATLAVVTTIFLFGMLVGIFAVQTVWIPGKGMVYSNSDVGACLQAVELALKH